jgi:pimeloyl-ACP methyl ester carboxylesterase
MLLGTTIKTTIHCILLCIFFVNSCKPGNDVPVTIEYINFQSDHFEISAELRIPEGDSSFPLVIMVHGDGPAYKSYFNTLKLCFLEAGYATLIWDKPGFGNSKGKFSNAHLREERANILVDGIKEMKIHPKIDSNKIGVWGISQAGYVIPIALTKSNDISFMILVGVAGENGIRQTAYFVSQQILCEGFSESQSSEAKELAIEVCSAKTYEEYVEAGTVLLDKYPIVKELDFMAGILPEEKWIPSDPNGESYYNPIEIIKNITIPTLVFMGEKDRNCDPIQSIDAYKQALTSAGNLNFKVILIPGTDHNIIFCKTGCQKERMTRSGKEWSNYAPEYLNTMKLWLKDI